MMRILVDSFQLFTPCDKALEDHLYSNGLKPTVPVRGRERATMPILYCDNTVSTLKKPDHLRKYAFEDASNRRWRSQYNGVVIPSENFYIEIEDLGKELKISMDANSDYHLEFKYKLQTDMTTWENWFAIYMPIPTAISMMRTLGMTIMPHELLAKAIHEVKQTTGKREDFHYFPTPVASYQFTYESFASAKAFMEKNGFNGQHKGIAFDGTSSNINPFMKVGCVHTKEEDGDYNRNPQIAIKLAQRTLANGTRPRGELKVLDDSSNHIVVDKQAFARAIISAIMVSKKEVFGNDSTRKMQGST
jgi:hypothetical protein